ncbi:Ferredoxin-thioredoxin reductase, variable chain [Quillaja saponaria]|uniref:Ferredoxin-thioredoxin reductase, variable chain n=1 Tax=Quillaja saponaria TaxID=32244 RepID=A0AAD7PGG7_QUISA|nr:Ferredoxin-thioredoxin reductase, variable chain [Quillaja saponaria]
MTISATTTLTAALVSLHRPNPLIVSSSSSFCCSSPFSSVDNTVGASSNCTLMVMKLKTQMRMIAVASAKLSPSSVFSVSRRWYCPTPRRRTRNITCEVAFKSSSDFQTSSSTSAAVDVNDVSSSPPTSPQEENDDEAKIGSRVRVKVPLKVYHVPKVPEVDLTGMEGQLKQYVAIWKAIGSQGRHWSLHLRLNLVRR